MTTDSQADGLREALDTLQAFTDQQGYAPTTEEAAAQSALRTIRAALRALIDPATPARPCPWCDRPAPHTQAEHFGPATLIGPDEQPLPATPEPVEGEPK